MIILVLRVGFCLNKRILNWVTNGSLIVIIVMIIIFNFLLGFVNAMEGFICGDE